MRQGPGDPQALPRPGSTVVSSRVIDVSSPSASSVAGDDEQRARDAHHARAVAADEGQRAERPREEQPEQQERNAEPEAVGDQQERPVGRVAALGGEAEDRGKRRPDAGRPADRERETGQERADRAPTGVRRMSTRSSRCRKRVPGEAGEHDAHRDHQEPGDDLERPAVVEELPAEQPERRRRRARTRT